MIQSLAEAIRGVRRSAIYSIEYEQNWFSNQNPNVDELVHRVRYRLWELGYEGLDVESEPTGLTIHVRGLDDPWGEHE